MEADSLCLNSCEKEANELQNIAGNDDKYCDKDEIGNIVQHTLPNLLKWRENIIGKIESEEPRPGKKA